MPKSLGGHSIPQFHQNILLMHFANQAFCHSQEVSLVDEWRKNKLSTQALGSSWLDVIRSTIRATSTMTGSKQAKQRYDFLSCGKFPGCVSCQKPGIGLLMHKPYRVIQ